MKTKKPSSSNILPTRYTADFIKKVLSLYTHSMTTIYLSLSAQVAKSTFFMKSSVAKSMVWPPCFFYFFIRGSLPCLTRAFKKMDPHMNFFIIFFLSHCFKSQKKRLDE